MQGQLDRVYFMDPMRAILMILGVVLHSAHVFNPTQQWAIYSHHTHAINTVLIEIIHTFRMPAFFVVAGYFCHMTLNKYGAKTFLKLRLTRLLVPFFFTALTLNSLQALLLNWYDWQTASLYTYLTEGRFISHLWFLINLTLYFLATSAFVPLSGHPVMQKLIKLSLSAMKALPLSALIGLMPCFVIFTLALNKIGVPIYYYIDGNISIYTLLLYAPFFIFGLILSADKNTFSRFTQLNPCACLIGSVGSYLIAKHLSAQQDIFSIFVSPYLNVLSSWLSVALCFYVFKRFFDKPSQRYFYLAEASYTIYLFHHVLVIGLGLVLIQLDVTALMGTLLLITLVSIITIGIHRFLIANHPFLLFMFNGRSLTMNTNKTKTQ